VAFVTTAVTTGEKGQRQIVNHENARLGSATITIPSAQVRARGHVSTVVITDEPRQPKPPMRLLSKAAESFATGWAFREILEWLLGGNWHMKRRSPESA
jgi:hypothetical protein